MKNSRIVQLIGNKVWGGGEKYVFDLYSQLKENGYKTEAISRHSDIILQKFSEAKTLRFGGVLDLSSTFGLAKLILKMQEKQIIIHAHNFKTAEHAIRVKQLLRGKKTIKVVVTRHLVKPAKTDLRSNIIYKNIDALIFVSNLSAERFLSSHPSIKKSKIHIIHNAVKNSQVSTISVHDPNTPLKIGFLGRLSREKGIELMLDALSLISDLNWNLLIAGTGDGNYPQQLQQYANQKGIAHKIEWLGFINDTDQFLNGINIGLFPSTWEEPFGLVILDYMRHGLAIVSTDTGAQKEILTNGEDGLLVKLDAKDMAAAIKSLIQNPELRERLSAQALQNFKKFGYDTFFQKMLKVYESL